MSKNQALFCQAVDKGNIEDIKKYAELGANANTPYDNFTGIYIAAQRGRLDVLNLLKELGADFNTASNNRGETPMFVAVHFKQVEVIKLLAKWGCDPNLPAQKGFTPMLFACELGNLEVVKALVAAGGSVNATTPTSSPLYSAAQDGRIECMKFIVGAGADLNWQNPDGTTALSIAVQEGQNEAVRTLIDMGADLSLALEDGSTPLIIAVSQGKNDMVKLLVENGSAINAQNKDGATAVYVAAQLNNLAALELLGAHGADMSLPQHQTMTPLMMAAQEGSAPAIKILAKYGADINAVTTEIIHMGNATIPAGKHAVMFAASFAHIAAMKELISLGVDINKWEDEMGATALGMAAVGAPIYQAADTIKQMLAMGAEVNHQNSKGETALFLVSCSKPSRTSVMNALIEGGADVNLATHDNTTPVSIAAQYDCCDAVRVLFKAGADINKARDNGLNPMLSAAEKGHATVIKLLYTLGADMSLARTHPEHEHDPAVLAVIEKIIEKMGRECECCGSAPPKLFLCGGCQKVRYCSKECQATDRKKHKHECIKPTTAAAAAAATVKK